jgi:hypothetical protein
MTAVQRTEMASNRERSEKKPFICCQWKNSLSSLELLMVVHVVQQIDICFKRKTDVSYVESKQTWCAKPATPSKSESEQPRSVFLRRKRCTWWGFSRLPHITGPHFPHTASSGMPTNPKSDLIG